ncbi:hypothetical protein X798_08136 [Onchocerca flexuosa]|uniref:Uncharacterized protein n=1 Tax=Onchocerca flexuosa TaxID=387005 RepID=A0A238BI73_9BILA|nr:hypothetical protein X798_08136 [Onchocerca flexuosa]
MSEVQKDETKSDPDRPRVKDSAVEFEDLLDDYEVQRIDMRRDISLISNARLKNNLEEGIKLIYEALRRQEAPVKGNQSFIELGTGNRMAAILIYVFIHFICFRIFFCTIQSF